MPLRSIDELVDIREWATAAHRGWKRRSYTSDLVAKGEWSIVWDDLTVQAEEPLVGNIYAEALEDKAASAASIIPQILVGPARGTRSDRAEMAAQKRRRAFVSIMQRSNIDRTLIQWYQDWWQHGAMFGLAWTDWNTPNRDPFVMRVDPRQVFPIAHNSKGELTAVIVCRLRRFGDLEQEWGYNHPSINQIRRKRERDNTTSNIPVEEIMYFDETHWGMALYDDGLPEFASQFRYTNPMRAAALQKSPDTVWLMPPTEHRMRHCPLVEAKRATHDGEYRGALDKILPNLRIAQNFMARVLDDIEMTVYGPVVMDNITNPHEYGPGARLIGDGTGGAKVEYPRPPSNFEAAQHISQQLESARQGAKMPQQRQGEFGASIASAKGVNAVMGEFNTEQAWAQRDGAMLVQRALERCAELDETWCNREKEIDGYDEGEMFTEKYTPANLWNGDWRVYVTFGGAIGMDMHGYLLTLATAKNLEGMASRTFMQKSGLVDNPLSEEREMMLENIASSFIGFALKQADEAGNLQPLIDIAMKIDNDKISARAAVMEVIKETYGAVPTSGGGGGAPGGAAFDPVEMARSMSAGGVPGLAEGQPMPQVGPGLAGILPPEVMSAAGELAPGGTAA